MSITLEEFRASILAPWHGDQSAACAAAAQAMFAATVTHGKAKRGTILVAVADAAAQTAVIAYLASFLLDEAHLMHLRSKVGTDEVTVSGLRTLVLTRGTARRPRNVLEKIEMAGDATAPAEMSHEEWLRRLQHCLIGALDRGKAERKLDDETLRVINSLRKHQDMEPLDAAEAYEQADASHNQSRNSQSA